MKIPKTDNFVFKSGHGLHFSNLAIEGWPGLLSDAELQRCEAENPWLLDRVPFGTAPYWRGIRTRVPESQFELKGTGTFLSGYEYFQQGELPELAMDYILRSACPEVEGVEVVFKKNSSLYAKLFGRTVEPKFHIHMRDRKQIEFVFMDGDSIPTSILMFMRSQYSQEERFLQDSLVAHGLKCQPAVEAHRGEFWEIAIRSAEAKRNALLNC
jgi:hypothetical protein